MRALMIAQSNYNYDPRVIRLATSLSNQNMLVDVICLRYEGQNSFDVVDGINVYRIMENFSQDSITSYVVGSISFLIKAFVKSVSLENKNSYNIVHVHNMPDYLVFSALLFKLKRVPIILDIHDLTVELFKEKWAEKRFNRFKYILKYVEKISCNFADHVLTVTKECVDLLVSRGIAEKKITLIMNSADETLFTYSDERFSRNRNRGFKFVYHGTVAPRFGLHYFINAMPKILQSIPGAEFHTYGSYKNEYSEQLKATVKSLGIEKSVFFKNHIPYSQINEMIREYDMGVVTYEQTEYMNLALPTKAGEYALTGLPFIISDLISVRTVFRNESVCYVNPENTNTIAAEITNLYKDPNLRSSMSSLAYEDMLKISWNKMSEEYLALVNRLIIKNK